MIIIISLANIELWFLDAEIYQATCLLQVFVWDDTVASNYSN